MYTRSYYSDEGLRIPENYDGTSILGKDEQTLEDEVKRALPKVTEGGRSDVKMSPPYKNNNCEKSFESEVNDDSDNKKESRSSILSLIRSNIGFLDGFGAEELLILGLAIFLFISKYGDKECALMLLLLIFV